MLEHVKVLNITNKKKLKVESKVELWKTRCLTFEEKPLIVKTFGLSQLIYGLQVYGLKDESMKKIESIG